MSRANRSTSFRRLSRVLLPPPTRKSVRRRVRPVKKESLHAPPKGWGSIALIAARARDRSREKCFESRGNGTARKKENLQPPSRPNPCRDPARTHASARRERVPPSAESGRPGGVVRADRASSPACYGRLPLLRDGGARLRGQRARQPLDAAANIRDQRAVAAATIEARQGRAGMVGGGGFAAEGALRLRSALAARLLNESSSFLSEHTSPNQRWLVQTLPGRSLVFGGV